MLHYFHQKVEAFLENEEKKSILSKRISVRKFRKKVVTKEKIMRILKYAMASPSAGNSREWEFIVVTEDAAKEKNFTDEPICGSGKKMHLY